MTVFKNSAAKTRKIKLIQITNERLPEDGILPEVKLFKELLEKEWFIETSQRDAEAYPVLVTDWVEGEHLDCYLRAHLRYAYALQLLAYRFCRMRAWLLSQSFAHGT